MASLTLKNIPDDLLDALRRAAQKDRRSLTQEILHILDTQLRGRGDRPVGRNAEVETQVAAWRDLAGKWKSDVDSSTEAEQIMARRTPGRAVDM